ncbi:ATP-binding protein [Methylonatrum kenyense]|uniref:ATP-binding protein n=1 Tax=Methylonatrum kenyense TaxID=455253 RepID=UPI0020C17556|nr:ATP-binding protein [Methylonatrum kenyense]MCK8515856.1 ATP-binding protein [Methylonatrum kenyense]
MSRLREKERSAILSSLRAGVVPRVGQHHIQVGRQGEIEALIQDIETIADGGGSVRFIIGQYGSGKTFFLNLIRAIAMEKKLVTVSADLSPDRRLHATGGQARSLYSELMRNLATRAKPEGGAVASVTERFVSSALQRAKATGISPESAIREGLDSLTELTGGYAFSEVVEAYWHGHDRDDVALKQAAVRWLRGEYQTRTDARRDLGVRGIIDDENFYDSLKLMARFTRLAGFEGLMVTLDEMVNLYKLSSTQARRSNYEQILRMVNDALQGNAVGLGFLFGGTPEFLMSERRGLYSYEALHGRLAENRFAAEGLRDLSGPVIHLTNLQPEDLYVLLKKIRSVYAGDAADPVEMLPDEGIQAFLHHCHAKVGSAYFKTPRNAIREFVHLLSVIEQNPGVNWGDLVGRVRIEAERPDQIPEQADAQGAARADRDPVREAAQQGKPAAHPHAHDNPDRKTVVGDESDGADDDDLEDFRL